MDIYLNRKVCYQGFSGIAKTNIITNLRTGEGVVKYLHVYNFCFSGL